MENLITLLLNNSIAMSWAILFLLLLSRIFFKKYSAKWRYYTWIVLIIGLLVPFRPHFNHALIQIEAPIKPFVMPEQIQAESLPMAEIATWPILNLQERKSFAESWYIIAGAVWGIGFIILSMYHLWKHRKFIKMVNRWSKDTDSEQVIALLHKTQKDLYIANDIGLKICKFAGTPMLIGFLKPVILLPANDFQYDELELIFMHELIHYKRKDLWYKVLVLLTVTVHWFNPFVYLMASGISTDCEISCDEAVLRNSGLEKRKLYGETIIGIIKNQAKMSTVFSTGFYGGMKSMKKRLVSIMDMSKKRVTLAIICCACVLSVTALSGVRYVSANAQNIINDTEFIADPLSEFFIEGSMYGTNSRETLSNSKKIIFDIASIKANRNTQLGGYTLQKGDTVQIKYEFDGDGYVDILMFKSDQDTNFQSGETKILIGTEYTIPEAGDYYFRFQDMSENGQTKNVKGTIQFNYQKPQPVKDEKIQFMDDELLPAEQQSAHTKSPNEGMFDEDATVLAYHHKNRYTADSFQDSFKQNYDAQYEKTAYEASLAFDNFSGSKLIYEFDYAQAATDVCGMSADVAGEFKIAFISEDGEVIMTYTTYNWISMSKPIDFPKGKIKVVLVGEEATGGCTIVMYH